MTNKERALEFVKKYPNMFSDISENWFWVDAIEKLLDESNKEVNK